MKWWHDEHVRLANENPDWFKEHYDIRGRRRTADEIVDGQFLPKLTEGANPRWVATDSLPSADRGAAKLHEIPKEFAGAEWVDLMETDNGARRFDQLYLLDNGTGDFLIVEAKAPGGELDWRMGAGDHALKRVKQGTLEYVHTILEEMKARGGTDKGLAEEMARALRRKKVQYVMVQANKHTGSRAGAELNFFDLYREGR